MTCNNQQDVFMLRTILHFLCLKTDLIMNAHLLVSSHLSILRGKRIKSRQQKPALQCGIHRTGHKCRCVIEMAHNPTCFAMGVGEVKGDQSTAVFRGSNAPLGSRTDRSPLAGSHFSLCLQPDIYPHYEPRNPSVILYI